MKIITLVYKLYEIIALAKIAAFLLAKKSCNLLLYQQKKYRLSIKIIASKIIMYVFIIVIQKMRRGEERRRLQSKRKVIAEIIYSHFY